MSQRDVPAGSGLGTEHSSDSWCSQLVSGVFWGGVLADLGNSSRFAPGAMGKVRLQSGWMFGTRMVLYCCLLRPTEGFYIGICFAFPSKRQCDSGEGPGAACISESFMSMSMGDLK